MVSDKNKSNEHLTLLIVQSSIYLAGHYDTTCTNSFYNNLYIYKGKIREGEVKQLRMFQYLEGSQFFAWNCAPFLVALSSFATYTTIAGGILDSQTAFVSLTLFNTLRGPLFLLPFGIAAIIQGNVALKRINTFLNAEELDKNSVRK